MVTDEVITTVDTVVEADSVTVDTTVEAGRVVVLITVDAWSVTVDSCVEIIVLAGS